MGGASLAEQLLAASASQLQLDPFPQHVRDLLRATVMEREIRREKPPKIKDHQTARSTMLNIQDQRRPVKANELGLGLPRAAAHQRKLRHSQEDQEARKQRRLDPAQQAARLERAEVRAARVKALKRRAKMERRPKSPTMMFLARAIPRRSRRKLSNTIRNSSKAMTELLQLQRTRLTRSSGRGKEDLLIMSRNTFVGYDGCNFLFSSIVAFGGGAKAGRAFLCQSLFIRKPILHPIPFCYFN